jgi:SAM-dependent methyltransferase
MLHGLLERLKRLPRRLSSAPKRKKTLKAEAGKSKKARNGEKRKTRKSDMPPRGNGAEGPRSDATELRVFESPFSGDEFIHALECCPICGSKSRTLVSEYNRFVIFDAVDPAFARYNYSHCHDCGVVYAAVRPQGPRFNFLLTKFNEAPTRTNSVAGNAILYPGPLSEQQREMIRNRAAQGVFVSEHEKRQGQEYLAGLLKDLLGNAPHIELLASLLDLDGARILEIRPRTGAILNSLKRRHGAEVYALPIFPSQQLIVSEVYGIPAVELIDHESCAIPYDVKFDLIICNHQLTHSVHPQRLFQQLRDKLAPNGSIYLYNEVDDEDILNGGKSIFRVLNPFHMQTFDGSSLVRALAANKFRTTFLTHIDGEFACLVRLDPEVEMEPIPPPELEKRLTAYRRARDRSIISADERVRSIFQSEWPDLVTRAVGEGLAYVDGRGKVRLVKNEQRS